MPKNVIITGATKGIGYAILTKLAYEGFNIAFCARNKIEVNALEAEMKQKYPKQIFLGIPTDISIKSELLYFIEKIKLEWTSVAILVNNGGVFIPGEISNEKESTLENLLDANLISAYYLSQWTLPLLRNCKEKPTIFNMCSTASFMAYPNGGSYAISKAGLLSFSKNLREELKNTSIRVTAIMPGAVYTDSWKSSGIDEYRMMPSEDIAEMLWNIYGMSARTCVEEIIIRPQKGDL